MNTILIVEDNKDMSFLLTNILQEEGFDVNAVGNGMRALEEVKKAIPDLVLLDMRLPGMNGIEILEKFREIDSDLLVIMITAYADVKEAVHTMKLGAYDYITKPFNNEEMIFSIRKALQTRKMSKEIKVLKEKLNQKKVLVEKMGNSKAIQRVIKQVELIAPTNMSVILQGKSGTGKEVVANLIHQKSLRKDRPFVAVDCGAIPDTLIESELFGYEKGAFTGANTTKAGKFEEANGGTILLDEITNLPIDGQAKLLRLIETRKVSHVGGKKSFHIDVRIIATTNQNFHDEMKSGHFREDLFHRLNEFQIALPELKDREDDIIFLAGQFLKEANLEFKKNVTGFSVDAERMLLEYNWPGNIRELKHTIKRATLLAEKSEVEAEHLSFVLQQSKKRKSPLEEFEDGSTFDDITRQFERDLIEKAIEKAGGNKTKAAGLLNMNRKTLYRKMNNLNLPL
ncbi:MAG: sigma-54 dependent transcriptional regulator [Candidatus Cloacimonadales bacterium]|nr:sigma-54 dependent transcriptional regulator [Candidatus Cloacimonadales bacterium]